MNEHRGGLRKNGCVDRDEMRILMQACDLKKLLVVERANVTSMSIRKKRYSLKVSRLTSCQDVTSEHDIY